MKTSPSGYAKSCWGSSLFTLSLSLLLGCTGEPLPEGAMARAQHALHALVRGEDATSVHPALSLERRDRLRLLELSVPPEPLSLQFEGSQAKGIALAAHEGLRFPIPLRLTKGGDEGWQLSQLAPAAYFLLLKRFLSPAQGLPEAALGLPWEGGIAGTDEAGRRLAPVVLASAERGALLDGAPHPAVVELPIDEAFQTLEALKSRYELQRSAATKAARSYASLAEASGTRLRTA